MCFLSHLNYHITITKRFSACGIFPQYYLRSFLFLFYAPFKLCFWRWFAAKQECVTSSANTHTHTLALTQTHNGSNKREKNLPNRLMTSQTSNWRRSDAHNILGFVVFRYPPKCRVVRHFRKIFITNKMIKFCWKSCGYILYIYENLILRGFVIWLLIFYFNLLILKFIGNVGNSRLRLLFPRSFLLFAHTYNSQLFSALTYTYKRASLLMHSFVRNLHTHIDNQIHCQLRQHRPGNFLQKKIFSSHRNHNFKCNFRFEIFYFPTWDDRLAVGESLLLHFIVFWLIGHRLKCVFI